MRHKCWLLNVMLSTILVHEASSQEGQDVRVMSPVDIPNIVEGRVQVRYSGVWGTVCDDVDWWGSGGLVRNWTDMAARVVCRRLGYIDGIIRSNAGNQPELDLGPVWFHNVYCTGEESSLWNCSRQGFNVMDGPCSSHSSDVTVRCLSTVRLHSKSINYGAVMVWNTTYYLHSNNLTNVTAPVLHHHHRCQFDFNAMLHSKTTLDGIQPESNYLRNRRQMSRLQYNLVCADGFNDDAAHVVCRMLGHLTGTAVCCSAFGDLREAIGYQIKHCTGNETSILDCPHQIGQDVCSSRKYASVACTDEPVAKDYELMLSHGHYGYVSVKYHGVWGYICQDGFDDAVATVICRQLGYHGGFSYLLYRHFWFRGRPEMGVPWLSGLNCTGNESNLNECLTSPWGHHHTCSTGRSTISDTSVFCYKKPDTSGIKFRLVNGDDSMSGFVEVSLDGQWGAICGKIDEHTAQLLCQELHFTGGHKLQLIYNESVRWDGPEILHINKIRCHDNDTSLMECPMVIGMKHGEFSQHLNPIEVRQSRYADMEFCWVPNYKARVRCHNIEVRLDPSIGDFGVVELWSGNGYHLICSDGFDDVAATVACRQMSYTDGHAVCCSSFGNVSSQLGYESIRCHGNETSLLQCNATKGDACLSNNYASAICSNGTDDKAYALRMDDHDRGAVSVRYKDVWGRICSEEFGDSEASVICRELGYQTGISYFELRTNQTGIPWLSNLRCNGQETRLADCVHEKWGSQPCLHDVDPAVICYHDSSTYRVSTNVPTKPNKQSTDRRN